MRSGFPSFNCLAILEMSVSVMSCRGPWEMQVRDKIVPSASHRVNQMWSLPLSSHLQPNLLVNCLRVSSESSLAMQLTEAYEALKFFKVLLEGGGQAAGVFS